MVSPMKYVEYLENVKERETTCRNLIPARWLKRSICNHQLRICETKNVVL